MNVTLGTGKAVHAEGMSHNPRCLNEYGRGDYNRTDEGVTCKKCLKILGGGEHKGDYDEMDAAHAEALAIDATVTEALGETPADQCCECGATPDYRLYGNYKGQMFCMPCANGETAAPVERPETEDAMTVGRGIYTDSGRVPSYALLVNVVGLPWIPGVREATVTTAMDEDDEFGLTLWVYARHEGDPAKLLYSGSNWAAAREARDNYTSDHIRMVSDMCFSTAGIRVEVPSQTILTVYRTERGAAKVRTSRWTPTTSGAPTTVPAKPEAQRFAVTNPPLTAHETDPRTGLPIVTVRGDRFVVGLWQRQSFGNVDYVDFWLASESVGNYMVRRAYADASPGTVARQVWDAQRALR